jgi:hypothetical protein
MENRKRKRTRTPNVRRLPGYMLSFVFPRQYSPHPCISATLKFLTWRAFHPVAMICQLTQRFLILLSPYISLTSWFPSEAHFSSSSFPIKHTRLLGSLYMHTERYHFKSFPCICIQKKFINTICNIWNFEPAFVISLHSLLSWRSLTLRAINFMEMTFI